MGFCVLLVSLFLQDAAHDKAVRFIKAAQQADGSFGDSRPVGGLAVHRSTSALCTWAVLDDAKAAGRGIGFLLTDGRDRDVWGEVWTIHALLAVLEEKKLKKYHKKAKKRIDSSLKKLSGWQRADGGWDASTSFSRKADSGGSALVATAVIAFIGAKDAELKLPAGMLAASEKYLSKISRGHGIWDYNLTEASRVEGALGRAGVCELAAIRAGKAGRDDLRIAVENFFKYHHILSAVRDKRGTYMGTGGTAPFYFMFGHMWMARALGQLKESAKYGKKLRQRLTEVQEKDGSFADWPMAKDNKVYATAMGALALRWLN